MKTTIKIIAVILLNLGFLDKSYSKTLERFEVLLFKAVQLSPALKWEKDENGALYASKSIEDRLHEIKIVFEDGQFIVVPSIFTVFEQDGTNITQLTFWPFAEPLEVTGVLEKLKSILVSPGFKLHPGIIKYFDESIKTNTITAGNFARAIVNGKNTTMEIGFKYKLTTATTPPVLYFPIIDIYKK